MSDWISVKDGLPTGNQKVWVALLKSEGKDYFVRDAVYTPTSKYPFSGDGPSVVYWMPRQDKPAPPQKARPKVERT